jgi:PAS domain S-box-containing protein
MTEAAPSDSTKRDATPQAEAELLARELHRVLLERETILANTTIGIALLRGRDMVWANEQLAQLMGYASAELRGRSTAMLYPSVEAFEALGREAYSVLSRGGAYCVEQPMRRKDGSVLWARLQGKRIDLDDEAAGSIWTFEDVTDRLEMEARLRASEEKYSTLFEVLPVGVSITDAEGKLVDNNPASERLLGLPRAGHLQRTIDGPAWHVVRPDLTPMPPEEFASVRALREGRVVESVEMGVRRPDGATAWLEVTAAPIPVEGLGVAVVYSDVTERRSAAAERDRLNAQLEARVREEVASNRIKDQVLIAQSRQAAMGEMIGNIAHQWRQPLNALGLVLSNLDDAADDGPLSREAVRKAVEDGKRLVQRMSTTINDFRDFFLPEKAPCVFSAWRQVTETVALVRESFQHRGIDIDLSPERDLLLSGFPNEYSQVVLNLLTNAKDAILAREPADAGEAREGRVGRVALRLRAEGGFGVLSVRDDGGGICESALDRIFDPYFSTKATGTGIGLYMSKTIVERNMKGRIEARNVVGGAELLVLVPLAEEAR